MAGGLGVYTSLSCRPPQSGSMVHLKLRLHTLIHSSALSRAARGIRHTGFHKVKSATIQCLSSPLPTGQMRAKSKKRVARTC